MATALTVNQLSRDGSNLTTEDADLADGNTIAKDANQVLLVSMFSVVPCTVSVEVGTLVDGMAVPDREIVLTPGTVKLWTATNDYRKDDGLVHLQASAACSFGVYAF
jgi:hypothetical protein